MTPEEWRVAVESGFGNGTFVDDSLPNSNHYRQYSTAGW